MRCFYVLKKWSSAKLSLNRDLSLNKMSLNRDCTVVVNLGIFESAILIFFASSPLKSVNNYRLARMGRNSYDYPGFQPKSTFLYYFAHHWTTGIVYNLYIVQVTKYFLLHRVKNGISLIFDPRHKYVLSTLGPLINDLSD